MDARPDRCRVRKRVGTGALVAAPDRCRRRRAVPTLAPTPSRREDAVQAAPPMPSLDPNAVPIVDALVVRAAIARCASSMERHAAWLTRLDAVLGDGDHGDNLAIGFRAVTAAVDALPTLSLIHI